MEQERDFLGYLINLARWSIRNEGECINEKTPSNLRDEILKAIEMVKKLKVLLGKLAYTGYKIRGGQSYPDYDLYRNYYSECTMHYENSIHILQNKAIFHRDF